MPKYKLMSYVLTKGLNLATHGAILRLALAWNIAVSRLDSWPASCRSHDIIQTVGADLMERRFARRFSRKEAGNLLSQHRLVKYEA